VLEVTVVFSITNSPTDGPDCPMEHLLWNPGSLPCVHDNRILACEEKNQQRLASPGVPPSKIS